VSATRTSPGVLLEGASPRSLGVRGSSGIQFTGGYSCHFQASSMGSRIFSWLFLSIFVCLRDCREAVDEERRMWDRRLASSGWQAPMRTSQAFETSLRDGSQTPRTSTHLENIRTPHPFGFRSTAFPLAAASCQLYSACYSPVRGSVRLWTPHLARKRRPRRCAPRCVAALDRERTKVVRFLLPFRCLG
jgi:hypothetical protein